MAKAEAEGQLVNIPVHPPGDTDGVTEEMILSALMVWRSWC